MDQGASAKERLPPAFAHLPLRVRIVVVRAHVFAAGLGKPFTSLRHGRGRSQKNNVSGAGGARNKRSSLATSGGGGFLGGRKKGVGAAGRQPGRTSADRHAIRNSRAPAAHAQDDPPTSGAHRGDDEVCLHPWSKRPSDGARRGPRERKSPTIGVSSARGRRAGCHGNPGAFIPNSSARSNPNPNPGHPELTLGFL